MNRRRANLPFGRSAGAVLVLLAFACSAAVAVDDPPAPAPGGSQSQASAPASDSGAFFSYTVRPGDSLSEIAAAFGLRAKDLGAANHLDPEAVLKAGSTVRVPNPFAARVKELLDQQAQLDRATKDAERRAAKAEADYAGAMTRFNEVMAVNRELRQSVHALPWWRDSALSAAVAALLMLGVTTLAVAEWLRLRRQLRLVAAMNDSLRRLDHKYKVLLAKAELRLQELYGRRRRGMPDQQGGAETPEEAEMRRLDEELKEILDLHLRQLASPFSFGRTRRQPPVGDLIAKISSPAQAGTGRRDG